MRSIGPYVVAGALDQPPAASPRARRDGRAAGPPGEGAPGEREGVETLRGVDRVTGMPVLLHRLPVSPQGGAAPRLPDSGALLPVSELDVWDAQSYAVTELPMIATPATQPPLVAQGVLRALEALHRSGLSHGGVGPAQFWQVGREVRLAGAGLPWRADATPEGDMADLEAALRVLGGVPAALAGLAGLTAAAALERLDRAAPPAAQTTQAFLPPAAVPEVSSPSPVVQAQTPEPPPGGERAAAGEGGVGPSPRADKPPPESSPPVQAVVPPAPAPALQEPPAVLLEGETPSQEAAPPLPSAVPPVPAAPAATPSPTAEALQPGKTQEVPAAGEPPVPGPSPHAPAQAEVPPQLTPQRSAQEAVVLGDELPEASGAPVAPASQDSPAAGAGAALTPIRIGFDEARDWDLPEWTPDLAREGAAAQPAGESPHRAEAASPPGAASPPPIFPAPAPSPPPALPFAQVAAGTPKPGRPGSPRSQPVRIGWEEDHSWRVVRSVPSRSVPSRAGPARRPWLSASGLPALGAALLGLGALGAGLYSYTQRRAVVNPCCTLAVQVSGAAGVPVRVTVQQAPPGSPLGVGALLGTAPGTLRFPNAPGRYRLRFEAKGHGAMLATVQLPSETPLKVELK